MLARLALVVFSAPIVLLAGIVLDELGGAGWLAWLAWVVGAAVVLVPLRAAPEPTGDDSVAAFRRDAAPRDPDPAPRLKGDKGLRPMRRLSGTDPLDAIWGTQSRFPVAPDDLGHENPYHLQIDDGEEGDEPR